MGDSRTRLILLCWLAVILVYGIWSLIVSPLVGAGPGQVGLVVSGLRVYWINLLLFATATLISLIAALVLDRRLARLEREAARAREQAVRDETVALLASTMSHEIFQPLTVIKAGAQIIQSRRLSPEERELQCQRIATAADRLAEIVRKIQGTRRHATHEFGGTTLLTLADDCDGASSR